MPLKQYCNKAWELGFICSGLKSAAWCSGGFHFQNGSKSKCYCRYAVRPLKRAEINSVLLFGCVFPVVFNQSLTVHQYFFDVFLFIFVDFFYLFVHICCDSLTAQCLWRLRALWEKIPIFCQWQAPDEKWSHVKVRSATERSLLHKIQQPGKEMQDKQQRQKKPAQPMPTDEQASALKKN